MAPTASSSRIKSKPYDRAASSSSKGKARAESAIVAGSLSAGINIGAPSTKQKSRKGKKAWRKNVDITAEEQALEHAREEERVTGGKLSEAKNDALFTIDTVGDVQVAQKLRRIAKPLRSLAVLNERSAVPSLTSRSTSAGSSKAVKLSSSEKARLRRIARKTQPADGETIHSADIKSTTVTLTDAWSTASDHLPVKAKGGFGEEGMVKRLPKAPVTLARRREMYLSTQVEGQGAVETPEGGTSYNPSVESHSRLIDMALEEERALLAREEDEAKRVKGGEEILSARRAPVEGEYAPGMTVGPGEMEEEDEDEDEDEEDEEQHRIKKKATKRKTQAQRNKAQRAKELARLEKMEAQKRRLLKSVGNVSALGKSAEEKRAAMLEAERLAKFTKREKERLGLKGGEKIGKHRVGKPKVTVQLGEDLAESLRQVKPEGNLFKDRFLALQKRALVEPRVPQLPKKRVRKMKEYEKHAYKQFV
ncbi:ribosome biogenesis protein Nop53/GLTSCR2 [Kockovaella imperatae]|uniref:Ribosome biogenesis protein NOP53 n=1 Tax=Kockovaella imperatae TaxID=4999 RepID=A0A1Y1UAK7_9TREE|nr:ribosome biogenesis protein Nop53/GLTSCR2 [Kockovaella imperatae]ORX35070.1 ribosome biogenesis protein Nop53/GLTSCR2 [Kockovaella imperatae]